MSDIVVQALPWREEPMFVRCDDEGPSLLVAKPYVPPVKLISEFLEITTKVPSLEICILERVTFTFDFGEARLHCRDFCTVTIYRKRDDDRVDSAIAGLAEAMKLFDLLAVIVHGRCPECDGLYHHGVRCEVGWMERDLARQIRSWRSAPEQISLRTRVDPSMRTGAFL